METSKPWYQSITVLAGSAVAFLQMIPFLISEIDKVVPADLSANPAVIQLLSIIAAIVTIYGRFTAKTILK